MSLFHGSLDLALGVPLGGGVPLVVVLLTLAEADLQLHPGVLEINAEGDQGQAVLLHHGLELADLPLVHQQPPGADGVFIEDVALFIGGDVHPVDVDLPVLRDAEGVLQVQGPGPDGLDLRPGQLDARLEAFLHKVLVEGLAVLRRDLDARLLHACPSLSFSGAAGGAPSARITIRIGTVYHSPLDSSRGRAPKHDASGPWVHPW